MLEDRLNKVIRTYKKAASVFPTNKLKKEELAYLDPDTTYEVVLYTFIPLMNSFMRAERGTFKPFPDQANFSLNSGYRFSPRHGLEKYLGIETYHIDWKIRIMGIIDQD